MPKQTEDTLIDGLTEMERKFCDAYTAIGSKTCANATKSIVKAGYTGTVPHTQGWRLLRKDAVKRRIAELRGMNADKILSDLEETRLAAMEKKDYATAARCSELQGKTLALFIEKTAVTNQDNEPLTPEREEESRDYAAWRMSGDYDTWKLGRLRGGNGG